MNKKALLEKIANLRKLRDSALASASSVPTDDDTYHDVVVASWLRLALSYSQEIDASTLALQSLEVARICGVVNDSEK